MHELPTQSTHPSSGKLEKKLPENEYIPCFVRFCQKLYLSYFAGWNLRYALELPTVHAPYLLILFFTWLTTYYQDCQIPTTQIKLNTTFLWWCFIFKDLMFGIKNLSEVHTHIIFLMTADQMICNKILLEKIRAVFHI